LTTKPGLVPGFVFAVLEHGLLCVACEHCHAERLVAFTCKRRGPPVAAA
jgi:predicted metal-binding protein